MNLIKSPLNYAGCKYRLLKKLLPLFPKKIQTFVDVFAGTGTVLFNVSAKKYLYNEINPFVYGVFDGFLSTDLETILAGIEGTINEYALSLTNEEGFARLRDDYNNGKNDWLTLYVLACYSFNGQCRWNKDGKYNQPFGRNRACFNDFQKENIIKIKQWQENKIIQTTNKDFNLLSYDQFTADDFVYFDPPYLGSDAVYQRSWNVEKEKELFELCESLNSKGVKFGLSNNLKYVNANPYLEKLCNRYNVYHLGSQHHNASHNKRDKVTRDDEVYIYNYKEKTQ